MLIYDFALAPNPGRVRAFLAEKGIDIPKHPVNIREGQQHEEPYVSKNPFRLTPFMELDDGTIIAESMAICRYLEELHPEPNLFGSDAKERAIVEMWNRRVEMEGFANLSSAGRNANPMFVGRVLPGLKSDHPQLPQVAQRSKELVTLFLPKLNAQLASNAFIAGDRFTVADITGVFFMRGVAAQKFDLSECPNVVRWNDAVSARPCFNQAD
jgi:glutathione S-transferase